MRSTTSTRATTPAHGSAVAGSGSRGPDAAVQSLPQHHQLNLGPALLANETPADPVRPKYTQRPDSSDQASALAAELFNGALDAAKISTAEAAYLLGISESLVRRMRSTDARERVSFVQMLRLPPAFHVALHREMNARFGFGRQALRDLLEAAGTLAMGLDR